MNVISLFVSRSTFFLSVQREREEHSSSFGSIFALLSKETWNRTCAGEKKWTDQKSFSCFRRPLVWHNKEYSLKETDSERNVKNCKRRTDGSFDCCSRLGGNYRENFSFISVNEMCISCPKAVAVVTGVYFFNPDIKSFTLFSNLEMREETEKEGWEFCAIIVWASRLFLNSQYLCLMRRGTFLISFLHLLCCYSVITSRENPNSSSQAARVDSLPILFSLIHPFFILEAWNRGIKYTLFHILLPFFCCRWLRAENLRKALQVCRWLCSSFNTGWKEDEKKKYSLWQTSYQFSWSWFRF